MARFGGVIGAEFAARSWCAPEIRCVLSDVVGPVPFSTVAQPAAERTRRTPRSPWSLAAWCDAELLGLSALPLPWAALSAQSARCDRCGAEASACLARGSTDCPGLAHLDAVVALGEYDSVAGDAVRQIKGAAWHDGAWWWGRALAPALARVAPPNATLVPVPGVWWRTVARGIDHTSAIARGVHSVRGGTIQHIMRRIEKGRQASRSAVERRVRADRFACTREPHAAAVLIDDVSTTGNTLSECARVLRLAGADWVGAGVLAVASR